jgi:sugar phosphate isomerase/epimerase
MNVFCELDRGDAEIADVVAELDAMDYDGWIVLEQDRTVDATTSMEELTESVGRNLHFIARLVAARNGGTQPQGLVEPPANR